MDRPYARVTVTEKAEKSLKSGQVRVYGEEIVTVSGEPERGGIVDVYSGRGKYLGSGFYNDLSKQRVRIVSKNPNDRFDEAFWRRRLQYAVDYRKSVMGDDFACCRLVFGDADGFPGLTVDRFGEVLVAEVLSFGCERIKATLFNALDGILSSMGETVSVIYERSDGAIRALEGMLPATGAFIDRRPDPGAPYETEIVENGIAYRVDYGAGQKTGFFLDQKYNRRAVAKIARGRRVLDCCTHTGAFALNAAAGGAESVVALDISDAAVALARENAARNGYSDRVSFVCCDVFDYLSELEKNKRRDFDLIILDPPAFTKSNSTVSAAYRGYREINARAMRLLPRGGYLATCSCSHFMTASLFRNMLHDAAADAAVSLRQIEERQQAPDHPILWNVPETEYLKFCLFQVV
ncbi:MAG: class I SAM-dependent rRNA methyltransferase [Clostridia bacterium]|nr:class I SAM-dependent rRNA methyltransferase [Clostridia bacterium]